MLASLPSQAFPFCFSQPLPYLLTLACLLICLIDSPFYQTLSSCLPIWPTLPLYQTLFPTLQSTYRAPADQDHHWHSGEVLHTTQQWKLIHSRVCTPERCQAWNVHLPHNRAFLAVQPKNLATTNDNKCDWDNTQRSKTQRWPLHSRRKQIAPFWLQLFFTFPAEVATTIMRWRLNWSRSSSTGPASSMTPSVVARFPRPTCSEERKSCHKQRNWRNLTGTTQYRCVEDDILQIKKWNRLASCPHYVTPSWFFQVP